MNSKLKNLTEKQRAHLDSIPSFTWCESLGTMLSWDFEGFGYFTISQLSDILIDYIKTKRVLKK